MGMLVGTIRKGLEGLSDEETIDVFMAGQSATLTFEDELGGVGRDIEVTVDAAQFQLVGVIGMLSHEDLETISKLLPAGDLADRFDKMIGTPWASGGVILGTPS